MSVAFESDKSDTFSSGTYLIRAKNLLALPCPGRIRRDMTVERFWSKIYGLFYSFFFFCCSMRNEAIFIQIGGVRKGVSWVLLAGEKDLSFGKIVIHARNWLDCQFTDPWNLKKRLKF